MLTCRTDIRGDRGPEADTPGDDLETRLLVGVVQAALATLFVPAVFLILIVVGLYMIAEQVALRGAVGIRYVGGHRAAHRFHRKASPCATTIR